MKLDLLVHAADYESTCFVAGIMTQEARRLQTLRLRYSLPGSALNVLGNIAEVPTPRKRPIPVQNLHALELEMINLHDRRFSLSSSGSYSLMAWLDLVHLKSLELLFCCNAVRFLSDLANLYSQNKAPPLETFKMKLLTEDSGAGASQGMLNAVENVLDVSNGLRELLVYSSKLRLICSTCVTFHGPTLQSLKVHNRDHDTYSLADILFISKQCPALRQLALDLPKVPVLINDTGDKLWTLELDVQ